MLDQASKKFRAAGVQDSIEVICCDVFRHDRPGYYDVIVANFFLNIFSEPTMLAVMSHLASQLKPGGRMLIGDFSYPRGPLLARMFQRGYYFLSMFSFWLAGGTTLHPVYDYPQHFAGMDLQTESVKRFRVSALFPASFATITAVKH
jgi:demethylmenaquinone methyltransferase/2-methoxy-6-polyprenyl-1,4-benzoquinol methylase